MYKVWFKCQLIICSSTNTTSLRGKPQPGIWQLLPGLRLRVYRVDRRIDFYEATSAYHYVFSEVSDQIQDFGKNEPISAGKWQITDESIAFDIIEDQPRPHYPRLTWQTLDEVLRGSNKYYLAHTGFFESQFDILVAFNGKGFVRIGWGSIALVDVPDTVSQAMS